MHPETLNRVIQLGQDALSAKSKVAIIDLPLEPKGTYGLYVDGAYEQVTAAPGPRCHQLYSVDQIVPLVERYKTEIGWSPSVWYGKDGVKVMLRDDVDTVQANTAVVGLDLSPEFSLLDQFTDGNGLSQRNFIQKLRSVLADPLGDGLDGFLKLVRNVTCTNGQVSTGSVERRRESLDRSVLQEVKGNAGELPDEISLNIRVFDDPALKSKFLVRCSVDVDPSTGAFSLPVLAEGLQRALDDQMAQLGEMFSHLDCPVFYGRF